MAQEASTIARPYAEAVFKRALESDKLDLWSEMLELLAAIVRDPQLSGMIANPKFDRERLTELMLDIGGGRLTDEGQNLVKLLIANERLIVVPEIAKQFEAMKAEQQGAIEVHVTAAFEIKPAQEQQINDALSKRLGREVRITSDVDPELIGGMRIRAGDMVIDGSVTAQLQVLRHQLGL